MNSEQSVKHPMLLMWFLQLNSMPIQAKPKCIHRSNHMFHFFSVHSSLSRCFFILITTSAWKKAFKLHIRCICMCVTRAKYAYYWLLLTASATNPVICAYKSQKWPVYLNAHQHSTLAGTVSSIWKFHFNVINNNITRPTLIIIHDKTFK